MGVRRWLTLATGLVMLSVPVACALPAAAPVGAPSSSSAAPTSSVTSTPPAPSPTAVGSPTAGGTPPAAGELTLQGTAADGVERGCVVLAAADGRTYLLLGGDRQIITGGGRLEVVGRAEPRLSTTCQQGIPFQVTSVRRI